MPIPPSQDTAFFQALAQECLGRTEQLIAQHPARIVGTSGDLDAAHAIADQFRLRCDTVQEEAFTLHPDGIWYLGKTLTVCYILGVVSLALGAPWFFAGAVLALASYAYGILQFVLFDPFLDPLFPSAPGSNVSAALEPSEAARRQVLFVAHHDASYVFTFLEHCQWLSNIRLLLAIAFHSWLCVYLVVACVWQLVSPGGLHFDGAPLWITLAGLLFTPQLWFLISRTPAPGASDNLSSVSMALTLAEYFRSEAAAGRPLRQTRLVFVCPDGEEIGERGAKEYARRHGPELHALPTFVLNVDTVSRASNLTALTRDTNGTCKLSAAMAEQLRAIAEQRGIALTVEPLRFGNGATDAGAFAQAGLQATSIIGISNALVPPRQEYHTSKDTVERIEGAAVAATLALAAAYVRGVDDAGP